MCMTACPYWQDLTKLQLFVDSFRQRERVSMKSLDQARKSFGTDEDIILVGIILGACFNLLLFIFKSCIYLSLLSLH